MVVVTIIAIIAAIAIPNVLRARINANETAAIATLRNIVSSQAQFQAGAKADTDFDGLGEFGTFREMSGAIPIRRGTSAEGPILNPVILSGAFRNSNGNGEVSKSGYLFKIYLPNAAGQGISPDQLGSFAAVEESLAETTWCCYAWPAGYSGTGNRTFMVNQAGDIIATEFSSYSGSGAPLPPHAAFISGAGNSITGLLAVGTFGGDSRLWTQVK
jgi:type II secretory pathway pseudopilin PulG